MSSRRPEGWLTADIGSLFAVSTPGHWGEDGEDGGNIRVLRSANFLKPHGLKYATAALRKFDAKKLVQKRLQRGDILLERSGGSPAQPVGRVNRFDVDGDFSASNFLQILRPREGVDGWFAYYLLDDFYRAGGTNDLQKATTGIRNLDFATYLTTPVLLPPLDEQRQIAEVLRSVDEAVAALDASLGAARSVRQATLDDVMRGEASSKEHQPLEAVAEVRTGLAKNAGRQGQMVSLPYLRVANVQDGWIDLTEVKIVDVDPTLISRYSLQPGDVLLTEGGDYDKLGRGGVWSGEIKPCLHQNHVFAVRPNSTRLSSAFLALLTQSYLGRAYFLSCAKRTTNLASINSSQLKKLPVPVLSLSRQQEIALEIGSLDSLIAIENERVIALRRLRQAVSGDLLSGRVRVPALAPATSTQRAVQPAFKRAVFAAEVVYQLHKDERFGSVKHEKIVHLCELHLRLQDDLDRHAYKEAAGPYDPSARRSVERIFRQQKWFDPTRQDKRVVYQPLEASGGHARYFDRYFGDRKAEVQTIIDLLRPLTTQQCEIIATLYAVWNDFLIDGREPVDDEIVDGVLNNWTDSKRQIPEEKWRAALPWMRQKGLIPAGHGEKTRVAAT